MPSDPVASETIFDTISDRYQLVNVGWKDASTRIYGCVLHVDIKDGKIWCSMMAQKMLLQIS